MNGYVEHPLFSIETFYEEGIGDYPNKVTRIIFTSHTYDCHTAISGDCFSLKMKGDSTLYLMDICKSVYHTGDLGVFAKKNMVNTPGVGAQFLSSNRDISQLAELVDLLFDTVAKGSTHPKIKKDIKSVLDAFLLDDDLGEDDDDMPF